MLKECAKKANITKIISCHKLRHGRATFLANKLTDRQMKEFFGWSTSKMISTYCHLSGKDIDEAILKQHGIITNGNNGKTLVAIKVCERCKHQNEPSAKLCEKCYMPMDINEKRQILHDVLYELLIKVSERDPAIKKDLKEIVKEKGLAEMFR